MEYLLTCDCGHEFTVGRSQAGQELPCECGKSVRVPTLRGLSQLPVATMEEIAPKSSEAGGWGGWRGPAMALASAGFIIAAGSALWFITQRALIDTSYTVESEIEVGNELFDDYSPEELSLVWNNYEEVGIGLKDPPDYYLWNRYAEARVYLASICGGIATAFGLIALAIWFTSPARADN